MPGHEISRRLNNMQTEAWAIAQLASSMATTIHAAPGNAHAYEDGFNFLKRLAGELKANLQALEKAIEEAN